MRPHLKIKRTHVSLNHAHCVGEGACLHSFEVAVFQTCFVWPPHEQLAPRQLGAVSAVAATMERGKVARRDSREDYEQLVSVIRCWNERRVELFRITMPSEVSQLSLDPYPLVTPYVSLQKLEFEGVMKFYYQYTSKDGQKVATKCIRVQNSATVENVIEVLVQKFRPDLRMLPNLASYVLYEVHNDNGQEGWISSLCTNHILSRADTCA